MNERQRKKKKATMAELAVGGGLMAIFLPVIAFAVVGAVTGVSVGAAYTFIIQDSNLPLWPPLWPLLAVYGTLLLVMLFLGYRFSARFALLTRRLIGLRREQRRIRLETAAAVHAADSLSSDERPLSGDDTTQSARRAR